MIRTSSVGGNLVYKHINESTVPSFINGKLYRNKRPDNSKAEDIVIRGLTITPTSNQKQFVDVLAFVPDIQAGDQHSTPNLIRLEQIATKIVEIFGDGVYEPAYTITVSENQDENQSPDGLSHYVFFRLYFQIHEPIQL